MTIHVSLPEEMENLVHKEVKSGMYNSASEVVREALRIFFQKKDMLTQEQVSWIKAEIGQRIDEVKSGKAKLMDGEEYFAVTDKRFSE